jgi:hypothetical protein
MSKEYEEFKEKMQKDNPDIYLDDIDKAWDAQQKEKVKKDAKDAKEPKEQKSEDSIPALDNEEKVIKTTSRKLSDVINEKLAQLKDLATLEILLDVHTRMKKRLESIRKISTAQHIKVRGHWKTTPPEMHITGLTGKKITNDEVEISFGVYDIDEKGNKKEYKNYSDYEIDGKIVKKHLSSEYRVKFEIIETIKTNKPITREKVIIDRVNG